MRLWLWVAVMVFAAVPTFRFSGVAYSQLRLDVLVVRGCLRLRQGADGCRRCRHGCRQRCPADLPPPSGESGRAFTPNACHARFACEVSCPKAKYWRGLRALLSRGAHADGCWLGCCAAGDVSSCCSRTSVTIGRPSSSSRAQVRARPMSASTRTQGGQIGDSRGHIRDPRGRPVHGGQGLPRAAS